MSDSGGKVSGWGAAAVAAPPSGFNYLHCAPGVEIPILVLSSEPLVYDSHWQGRQPKVCAGPGCQSCAHGAKLIRRYLISVWDYEAGIFAVLDFGEVLAQQWAPLLPESLDSRGMSVIISREGRLKTSRYLVRLDPAGEELIREGFFDPLYERNEIPEAQDMVEALAATARRVGFCDLVVQRIPVPVEVGTALPLGFESRANALKQATNGR